MFSDYGHKYLAPTAAKYLKWDGVVFKSGSKGCIDGDMYRRWIPGDDYYDFEIANSMHHTRWIQMKRALKLNDNSTSPKRGQPDYNPCYKFDFPWEVLAANTIAFTQRGSLDLCVDETTSSHFGFGEAKTNVVRRVKGKPGVTKGMQTVLACDAQRMRIYGYVHRHNAHPKIPGWKAGEGHTEMRMILDLISPLVEGEPSNGKRKIFSSKPHFTCDNYFSGEYVVDYFGRKGYGFLGTLARNRFPTGIPVKYFQKEKATGTREARVARFNQPIVATSTVKCDDGDSYTKVLCSMQSTSSCNFLTVNSISGCHLFAKVSKQPRRR